MTPIDNDEPDEGGLLQSRPALAGVLLLFAVAFAVDLFFDAPTTWLSAHVLFELALALLSLSLAAYLWMQWRRTSRSLSETTRSLEAQRAERDAGGAAIPLRLEIGYFFAVFAGFGVSGCTAVATMELPSIR